MAIRQAGYAIDDDRSAQSEAITETGMSPGSEIRTISQQILDSFDPNSTSMFPKQKKERAVPAARGRLQARDQTHKQIQQFTFCKGGSLLFQVAFKLLSDPGGVSLWIFAQRMHATHTLQP